MKVLETERLILRRATVDDSEFILELLNDPSWLRFIGDRGVRTLDDARDYILKSLVAMYERLGFGLYLTELKGDGLPIGICGLIKRDSLEDVDIGFAFLPKFRGAGYGVESASAVMAYGKNDFGLKRIVAITSPDNDDSVRLLEKLGFKFERMVKLSDDSAEVSLFAAEV
ncbi:MAG TPA: GNAT family N-acetyltransferase [Pyrinomonadaceae bacterium]|jgi:RimJ/RimL family protein N-acetyltransferase|nr:GNAT family N-acetyltransferase [Pyrinomonadaceae bacterium]